MRKKFLYKILICILKSRGKCVMKETRRCGTPCVHNFELASTTTVTGSFSKCHYIFLFMIICIDYEDEAQSERLVGLAYKPCEVSEFHYEHFALHA